MVREDGVGPLYGPVQRHFDLHSRPSDAQIVFRYEDTLKAAYRLNSEYDSNLGRLSVPSERLPRLEALDEELFNMVATESGITEVLRLPGGADRKEQPLWSWHVAYGLRQRHLHSLVVPDGELTLPAGWSQIVREGPDQVHHNLGCYSTTLIESPAINTSATNHSFSVLNMGLEWRGLCWTLISLMKINKWINTMRGSIGLPNPLGWSCNRPFIVF